MTNRSQSRRRGAVVGVSALAGLAATLGAVGIAQHTGPAEQQRDIALVNAADDAHLALVDSQVAVDHQFFTEQLNVQENIYYWGQQNGVNMFPGDASDPQDSIFNGAITRWTEGALVGWALRQVQWDHFFGVNQTNGIGDDLNGAAPGSPGGYESAIGDVLAHDIGGSGITGNATLTADVAALTDPSVQESYSAFHDALSTLENDLFQTMATDFFGSFSL